MRGDARRFAAAAVWLAGVMAACAVQAADTPAADSGRKSYTSYCARCHGINLVTTGAAFDLRRFPAQDKERFVRSVSQGLRAMPAWESVVKPGEIDAIWSYIGSVNGWPQAASAGN